MKKYRLFFLAICFIGILSSSAKASSCSFKWIKSKSTPEKDDLPQIDETYTSSTSLNISYFNGEIILEGFIDKSDPTESCYLYLSNPHIDNIKLFSKVDGRWIVENETGDSKRFASRQLATEEFVWQTSGFFKISISSTSTLTTQVSVYNTAGLIDLLNERSAVNFLFAGMMLLLIGHALFSYLGSKNIIYLFYAAYALSFFCFFALRDGLAFRFVFPEVPYLQSYAVRVSALSTAALGVLFANRYIRLFRTIRSFELVSLSYIALVAIAVFTIIFQPLESTSLHAIILSTLSSPIMALGGLFLFKREGRFPLLLSGALLNIVGVVIYTLSVYGWLEVNGITANSMKYSTVFEFFIFSFSISLKIWKDNKHVIEKKKDIDSFHRLEQTLQIVRHDILAPFSVLDGTLNTVKMKHPILSEDDFFKRMVDKTLLASKQIVRLLRDLTDLNIELQLKKKKVSINHILSTSFVNVAEYLPEIDMPVTISLESDALIYIDEERFVRVLSNIITNACQATLGKGEIFVYSKRVKSNIAISIQNTGSKIDPRKIDKIFDWEYTSGKPEGRGIGLAASKRIVLAHNGSISCRNIPDLPGVEFEIFVPHSYDTPSGKRVTLYTNTSEFRSESIKTRTVLKKKLRDHIEASRTIRNGRRIQLAILDDEEEFGQIVRNILFELEVEDLVSFSSYSTPDNFLDSLPSDLQLLICDIDLKDRINGFDVISKLFAIQNTTVCICSNRNELAYHKAAVDLGVKYYFDKPLSQDDLAKWIIDALKVSYKKS